MMGENLLRREYLDPFQRMEPLFAGIETFSRRGTGALGRNLALVDKIL
jgi:hypothetical protein